MDDYRQQLHGIKKHLRNTNIGIEETLLLILHRLEVSEVIDETEYEHIEDLIKHKVKERCLK